METSFYNNLCGICLKTSEKLLKTTTTNSENVKWCDLLATCVPEVDWSEEISICQACADILQTVYSFRNQCIKSSYSRSNKVQQETLPQQNQVYRCLYCSKNYNATANSYKNNCKCQQNTSKQHTLLKNKLEFTCFHCGEAFVSKPMIRKHIRIKHGLRSKATQCTHCAKVFMRDSVLEKHLLKIHGINSVKHKVQSTEAKKDEEESKECNTDHEDCKNEPLEQMDDKSDSKLERTDGIKTIHTKPSLRIPPKKRINTKEINSCQECSVTFTTKYLLRRHIRNVHASEKNYECETCTQKFASAVYLSAHKRYHSGERPYICSFCGKGYITASDLYHHEKIHANKRAYRCEKCPKAFNTSSDLHKHKICVHQDRSEWKYVCEYCQRRFPLKTNLDMHVKIHTGERNFACHLCDKKCINRSVLMRHIESHSNVRSFKCSMCNQDYKYQKSLEIHLAKAHGIGNVKIPERTRKYFCHVCSKSYTANNKLQKHIRSHTGERPFSCQMCEKRFIDKSSVKQHLKTAHNVILAEAELGGYPTEGVL